MILNYLTLLIGVFVLSYVLFLAIDLVFRIFF
jgi:hypothetical protein